MRLVLPAEVVSLNEPGRIFARHHHLRAYVALIVSGICDEAGDCGRFCARAGDVLVHRPFEAHQDIIGPLGAKIINFHLDDLPDTTFGFVVDLDAIVRTYERDPMAASRMLREQFLAHRMVAGDWPDLLAERLSRSDSVRLDQWAELQGLHPNSLSRGFKLAYGVSPKRYRFEQMVSRAARKARASGDTLSVVAADAGFADQAHMTRAISAMFGVTPRQLRHLS